MNNMKKTLLILLSAASSAVDKAAAKGVISKNAASREKARMARELAKAAE